MRSQPSKTSSTTRIIDSYSLTKTETGASLDADDVRGEAPRADAGSDDNLTAHVDGTLLGKGITEARKSATRPEHLANRVGIDRTAPGLINNDRRKVLAVEPGGSPDMPGRFALG